MQVQRVGSANAATAAEVILLDTRAKLYGLLAADGGSIEPEAGDDELGRARRVGLTSGTTAGAGPGRCVGQASGDSSPDASDQ